MASSRQRTGASSTSTATPPATEPSIVSSVGSEVRFVEKEGERGAEASEVRLTGKHRRA